MLSLQSLTNQVRQAFIETGGLLPKEDMYSRFVNESNQLDIDEPGFYKQILVTAIKGLDLDKIEKDYLEKQKTVAEAAAIAKAADNQAFINELINKAFASHLVKASDLAQIFDSAEKYQQDIGKLAQTINDELLRNKYKAVQQVDTNRITILKEQLLSTDWQNAQFTPTPSNVTNRTASVNIPNAVAPKANKKVIYIVIATIVVILLILVVKKSPDKEIVYMSVPSTTPNTNPPAENNTNKRRLEKPVTNNSQVVTPTTTETVQILPKKEQSQTTANAKESNTELTTDEVDDITAKLTELYEAENNENITDILMAFSFPVKQYYQKYNVSYSTLENDFSSAFNTKLNTHNIIVDWPASTVDKTVSGYVIKLKADYTFTTQTSPNDERSRKVNIIILMNTAKKITSIYEK